MDASTPLEGTALKRILTEEGRRQRWLAGQTGIHESDISRIVGGGMDPGKDRAQAIASALRQTCTNLGWPQHDDGAEVAA